MSRLENRVMEPYRGRHRGWPGAIICTGPSLSLMKAGCLSDLKHTVTIGVNDSLRIVWPTTYHVAIDRLWWMEEPEKLAALAARDALFTLSWNKPKEDAQKSGVFIPAQRTADPAEFTYDLNTRAIVPGGVSFVALQIAVWMGLAPIYLVAMDWTDHDGVGHATMPHRPMNPLLHGQQRVQFGGPLRQRLAARGHEVYVVSPITRCNLFERRTMEDILANEALLDTQAEDADQAGQGPEA